MENDRFKEHVPSFLIGLLSGLLSGLFFALYTELKPQISNSWELIGSCFFVTFVYFLVVLFTYYFILFLKNNVFKKKSLNS